MSVAVDLDEVRGQAAQRATAYLLTVSGDGRPHAVEITVGWDGDSLVMRVGRSSARNAGDRPEVSVLWPPDEPGGYSLIVDGSAAVEPGDDGGRLTIQVDRAVLHRPGPSPAGPESGCTADCVPL